MPSKHFSLTDLLPKILTNIFFTNLYPFEVFKLTLICKSLNSLILSKPATDLHPFNLNNSYFTIHLHRYIDSYNNNDSFCLDLKNNKFLRLTHTSKLYLRYFLYFQTYFNKIYSKNIKNLKTLNKFKSSFSNIIHNLKILDLKEFAHIMYLQKKQKE